MKTKELPNAKEVEASVLGAMFLEETAIPLVLPILKPEHFYDKRHRIIYKVIVALSDEGIKPDSVSIYEKLKEAEQLETIGGAAYIAQLGKDVYTAANVEYHAKVILKYFGLRSALIISKEIEKLAEDGTADEFEVLQTAISKFESIYDSFNDIEDEKLFCDELDEYFEQLGKERNNPESAGYKTKYFPSFNKATGGLKAGNFVVLSGKYKSGKTTLGLSVLLDFVSQKIPCGIFSLEMAKKENADKIISIKTPTRYGYLRDPGAKNQGSFIYSNDNVNKTIRRAYAEFKDTKLLISDKIFDKTQIAAKIKAWIRKHGVKIILIDYIGLIEENSRYERRDLEIAAISRYFKMLAKKEDIIIIMLSQENDDGKAAESKALLRDCDFWFSIVHTIDEFKKGVELKIYVDGEERTVPNDESMFYVRAKGNRHNPNGTEWICQFHNNGSFNEIDLSHSINGQEYAPINTYEEHVI